MPFHTVQDARLHYRLEGRPGLPLLVLGNSLGTDLFMWDRQIEALTTEWQVLRFDTRGHGASEAAPGDTRVEVLARDVLDLVDYLGAEHFAYCGLSLGAMAGQWLGIHAGHRLTRLALSNASPFLPPREPWDSRIALVRAQGMAALADMAMPRLFSQPYLDRNEPYFHTLRASFIATPAEGYAACCAAVRDADFRVDLPRIATPTLVIGGTLDAATPPPAHAEPLCQAIPGARLVLLPAGHLANVEQPAAFNRALLDFLRG